MEADRLSQHFSTFEVFGEHDPSKIQLWLALTLATRALEPLRDLLGVPLYVTSGFRDQRKQQHLKQSGYYPYRFTDHSFGDQWQPFGVGAVDLVKLTSSRLGNKRREPFTEVEYLAAVDVLPEADYGQLIWYRKRGHLHISNPRALVYTLSALAYLGLPDQRQTYIKEG